MPVWMVAWHVLLGAGQLRNYVAIAATMCLAYRYTYYMVAHHWWVCMHMPGWQLQPGRACGQDG